MLMIITMKIKKIREYIIVIKFRPHEMQTMALRDGDVFLFECSFVCSFVCLTPDALTTHGGGGLSRIDDELYCCPA